MPKNDASDSSRVRVISLSVLEHTNARSSLVERPKNARPGSIAVISLGLKRVALVWLALIVTLFYPAVAYVHAEGTTETPPAETPTTTETAPVAETTSPPTETATSAPTQTSPPPEPVVTEPQEPAEPVQAPKPPKNNIGPTSPPGVDGDKYVYDASTGKWENDYYIWDPVTGQTKPKTPQTYSYNPETKMWDTTEWRYDAPSGKYVPNTVSVANNPSGDSTVPLGTLGAPLGDSSSHAFDLFYDASISNSISSQATSGNALVFGNTLGGSALSGDALALANIFNLLQSSASFAGGGQVTTFSSDIYGDVFGDLYIDPAVLASLQPASLSDDSSVTLNVEGSGQINNDITLAAKSGDATVQKNTTGGNATSGSATAVLNLINMINSAISTGGSFFGMLNIYGNLNGDILLPQNILDTLLAFNAATSGNSGDGSNVDVELNDNQSINNLVNASATSGTAAVTHNTTAGTATTGDASTNITLLNLTGRQVVGSNSLLVFVNVMGTWVGVIMDAPAGSTSAALGTGITQDNCMVCTGGDTTVNADTTSQINNKVNVTAASGDATVDSNTTGGNATSGDANAAANILNISNSSFSFADWFGVLFINVFGTWSGSFGVDTAAGEHPTSPKATSPKGKTKSAQVFKFVPKAGGGNQLATAQLDDATFAAAVEKATKAVQDAVKASAKPKPNKKPTEKVVTSSPQTENRKPDYLLPIIGFTIGGSLLGGERIANRRQRNKQ